MINILIVEDKTENLYLLQSLLDTNGFRTIAAKNGAEALGLMRNSIPDLIITDILMPVMDGFTLCRECKKDEVLKNIPFFFYTATYTNSKDEEYALSLGADLFILKPQEPDVFLKIISDFLEEVKKKNIHPKKIIQQEEMVVLKEYNEVLIRKIEDKMLQTEKSEKELKKYAAELEKEIDKRKKNEESLLKSEEYNRLLFLTSPVGLVLCRMDGSLVDINPAFAKIIGSTIEETLKLSYWDITPEKYADQEAEQLKNLEKTGHYGKYEKEYIHKDGHLVPVSLQGLILERDGERFIWSSVEDVSKRKEAEAALQNSQHLFQTLAQVSPVGIFRTDPDGYTTYVNPKWIELSGLSSEEAIGNGWLNAVHPEDRGKLSESWVNNFKSKSESRAEYRFLRPDGSIFWVMGRAVPELIDNKIMGYIGTITDITERKTAEEALRNSESQLSNALRIAHLGPWEYDVSNDLFVFNDLFYAVLDTTAEKVGGYTMKPAEYTSRFLYPADISMVRGEIKNALETDDPNYSRQLEHRIIFPDGEVGYINMRFSILKNDKGKTVKTYGVNQDITVRRKMENKVVESETYYRTLFEGANDAILIMSGDIFVECNDKTISMFGCSKKEDIINHHPWEYCPAMQPDGSNSKEKGSEFIKSIMKGKPQRFYWKHSKSNGDLFDAEVSLNKIEVGGKIFIQALVTDISNRKKAEEELIMAKEKAEESDKLKTAFLHNISHEVRTPMNAIIGFSDLIIDPDLTPEIRNEFIQTIVHSSNQLLSIITQIVNMATIEAGQEKIYKNEISLNSIFRLVFEQFRTEAERKNISLKYNTSLSDSEDKIVTDETKLIQIISNLISNALKFTRQGSINFGYVIKDKYLEFHVKDTGIGIPEEMHKVIFERFRQVETSPAREYEGAGLGLSISKAYVELLEGKIWLTSKLKEGSVFYFNIPYNKVSLNAIPEKEALGTNKIYHKKSIAILVAEDENVNFKLLAQYLSDANTSVVHASNGNEAVEICKNNKQINLVLMDLKMPVMDGFEATRIIKGLRPDLTIIAQTAYSTESDKEKAITCGCNDFISKPFKKEELLKLIREHLVLDY